MTLPEIATIGGVIGTVGVGWYATIVSRKMAKLMAGTDKREEKKDNEEDLEKLHDIDKHLQDCKLERTIEVNEKFSVINKEMAVMTELIISQEKVYNIATLHLSEKFDLKFGNLEANVQKEIKSINNNLKSIISIMNSQNLLNKTKSKTDDKERKLGYQILDEYNENEDNG